MKQLKSLYSLFTIFDRRYSSVMLDIIKFCCLQRQLFEQIFIIQLLHHMSEPVKYLSVVAKVLEIYQFQLMALFKRLALQSTIVPDLSVLKAKLTKEHKRLKQIEDEKSISQDKISQTCQPMMDFLTTSTRPKNSTSHSQRYALRSTLMTQDTHRMRLTGGLRKPPLAAESETIQQSAELDDLIRSYKIQQEIGPRMRMKWKSLKKDGSDEEEQNQKQDQQHKLTKVRKLQRTTIGDNNIDLLSYTIPEIENSIKRLSLQSGYRKERSPDKIFDSYRTVDTRSQNRKKYVSRLI